MARVRQMYSVVSSMLTKVGFDPTSPGAGAGHLVVQFKNCDVWSYPNVKWEDYLVLLNAESLGAAFGGIRTKYEGTKLNIEKDKHVVAQKSVDTPKPKDELPLLDVIGADDTKSKPRRRK